MELWSLPVKPGFSEIENKVVRGLRANEPVYSELWKKRSILLQQYPLLQQMSEGSLVLFSKEEDFEAWHLSKQLEDELEQMERRAIYMQGHVDGYSYLQKIGALHSPERR